MSKPITAVLLGAGNRGESYAPYALKHPDQLKFVAVADPNPIRRGRFAEAHNIPAERQFSTWEDALAVGKIADVLINATQDQMHHASALAALDVGYDMLLEKPMTNTLAETVELVQAAEKHGRFMQICHVLRYTPFFTTLNNILKSGRLGEVITVEHRENLAYFHMAHSFVRGNWRNSHTSSPMILAKCCHDFDILFWNVGGKVKKLQSFGSLRHFHPENALANATDRCTDDCPAADECPFDARSLYLNMEITGWPVKVITDDLSEAGRLKALQTGPYGRCVYKCDNNVVDNQTVNMEFEDGTTVVLVMQGHGHEEGRTMRYDGTKATLRGKFAGTEQRIEIWDHKTGECEVVDIPPADSGHGGGDYGIMKNFVGAIRGEAEALTTARESLESHLLAFAAEESRLAQNVIDMADFRQRAEQSTQ